MTSLRLLRAMFSSTSSSFLAAICDSITWREYSSLPRCSSYALKTDFSRSLSFSNFLSSYSNMVSLFFMIRSLNLQSFIYISKAL